MMKLAVSTAVCLALSAPVSRAQEGWGNLDALLFGSLTQSGTAEASYWLPDHPNPQSATRALGIVYEYIPGSAGNTGIAVGVFVKQQQSWIYAATVQGLFGQSPREPLFGPRTAEITTTMLGPNEPRCCPTLAVRWRIDLTTFQAQRLN